MAELQQIATAIDDYQRTMGRPPEADDIDGLCEVLEQPLPRWDPWGAKYQLSWVGGTYRIVSYGSDRMADATAYPPEDVREWRPESDIVLQGGEFAD